MANQFHMRIQNPIDVSSTVNPVSMGEGIKGLNKLGASESAQLGFVGGHQATPDEWADVEIAKMLARVKRVCIIELQWQIDALGK